MKTPYCMLSMDDETQYLDLRNLDTYINYRLHILKDYVKCEYNSKHTIHCILNLRQVVPLSCSAQYLICSRNQLRFQTLPSRLKIDFANNKHGRVLFLKYGRKDAT